MRTAVDVRNDNYLRTSTLWLTTEGEEDDDEGGEGPFFYALHWPDDYSILTLCNSNSIVGFIAAYHCPQVDRVTVRFFIAMCKHNVSMN